MQQIEKLTEERNKDNEQWKENKILEQIQKQKIEIEQLKFKAEEAERMGDYGKVAELRYGKIVSAEKQIKELMEQKAKSEFTLINEYVEPEDVAEVVAKWTGIPVKRMLESEREKLLRMEEELHKRIVGHKEAIKAVFRCYQRSRAGLSGCKRPIDHFSYLEPPELK